MNQGRILPLVGPAVVLYLIAEVVGSARELDSAAVGVCVLALALATVPFWGLRDQREQIGVRRVALLGVTVGVALVRWARPELPSLFLDLAGCLAFPLLGALSFHLALDTPDQPPSLRRRRRAALVLVVGGSGFAAIFSALAVGPAPWLFGEPWLVPHRFWLAAPTAGVIGVALGASLRTARRRMGSTPEALAANGWAQLGAWGSLVAVAVVVAVLGSRALAPSSDPVRALAAVAGLALVSGHVAMLGARRQVRAGRHTRRLLAGAIAVTFVAALAALAADRVPTEPVSIGVAAAFLVVGAALADRLAVRAVDRVLAPFGGRLLLGAKEALAGAVGATTLDELGAAVLPPLRRASGQLDAAPLLFAIDPPRAVRVDAAAIAHVESRELSEALRALLAERPGEIVVAAPLAEQVVRRAALRPLVEALTALEALAVVPLSVDAEIEGALVVPRGRRRAALTLEEIDALERLGRHLSAQVALLSSQERARQRTRDELAGRERLDEELESTREELERLRADARTLKAGGAVERFGAPAIAYSVGMRRLTQRLEQLGPLDAPVLLVGEEGSSLDRLGYLVHDSGGRRDGPFVVADCAAVRPERAEAALFGEGAAALEGVAGRPGWLRLASGGTVLLLDVPALSLEAQARLAEAIATRRATLADGSGGYAMDARVVATTRVALEPLVATGAFDAELHRRLEPLTLTVPPLRDRPEDLPSLVLLALDRTCRIAGRPVVGIEPDALAALADHAWPGNLRELCSVIDRAVAVATGPNVRREDLPPLAPRAPPADPWSGTFAEVEARLLERALERASGNKSEAARLLGLKRSTFLDKLKRHGMHGEPSARAQAAAK